MVLCIVLGKEDFGRAKQWEVLSSVIWYRSLGERRQGRGGSWQKYRQTSAIMKLVQIWSWCSRCTWWEEAAGGWDSSGGGACVGRSRGAKVGPGGGKKKGCQ